jgi:hypothetical protein
MRKGLVLGIVLGLMGFLYFTGRMNHALYPVGLNFNTCAQNGFGATFCGSELTQYQNRINGVQQQISNTEQTLTQQECQSDPQLSFCP